MSFNHFSESARQGHGQEDEKAQDKPLPSYPGFENAQRSREVRACLLTVGRKQGLGRLVMRRVGNGTPNEKRAEKEKGHGIVSFNHFMRFCARRA